MLTQKTMQYHAGFSSFLIWDDTADCRVVSSSSNLSSASSASASSSSRNPSAMAASSSLSASFAPASRLSASSACTSHARAAASATLRTRSEEHTSEPVTNAHLVCRLLLEKKKNNI